MALACTRHGGSRRTVMYALKARQTSDSSLTQPPPPPPSAQARGTYAVAAGVGLGGGGGPNASGHTARVLAGVGN